MRKHRRSRPEHRWDGIRRSATKEGEETYTMQHPDSLIDTDLPVSGTQRDINGETFSYYPSYSEINPAARATYLDWLATGKRAPQYSVGYVFLYFYGIERRFFTESPSDTERLALIAETERLLEIYGGSRSVESYLSTFVETARASMGNLEETARRPNTPGQRLSQLSASITLGRLAKENKPMDAYSLLNWYISEEMTGVRRKMSNVFPEFEAAFTQLFAAKFPNGIPLPKSGGRELTITYHPASAEFSSTIQTGLPEVAGSAGTTKVMREAETLAEVAGESITAYRRLINREPEARGTAKATVLLPAEIRRQFPSESLDNLRGWISDRIMQGGVAPIKEVVERVNGEPIAKLTKTMTVTTATALSSIAIGMAPDPRSAIRGPKLDEPVILFNLPPNAGPINTPRKQYQTALTAATVGLETISKQ